jgi:hypothetical protein
MQPPPPIVTDYPAWRQLIIERRLMMLERVIAAYPDLLKTHRTKLEYLRLRIRSVLR